MTDQESPAGDAETSNGDDEPVVDAELVEHQRAREGFRAYDVGGEVIETFSFRQAPYPTPEDLAKYEEIHPGFTDRILRLTERETEHRIQREERQDDATIVLATRGQLLAFVVVMALVLGGIAAILTDHSIVGIAGLVLAAATLSGAFIAPNVFARPSETPTPPGARIENTPPGSQDSAT